MSIPKPGDKRAPRIVMDICRDDIRVERARYIAFIKPKMDATRGHEARLNLLIEMATVTREMGLYSARQPGLSNAMFGILSHWHNSVRTPGDSFSWHKWCAANDWDLQEIRSGGARRKARSA